MSTVESVRERAESLDRRGWLAVVTAVLAVVVVAYGRLFPATTTGQFVGIVFERTTLGSALRLSVPIALAAIGGIFSEKSGVINIGLEGLLIVSAFTGFLVADATGSFWLGIVGGVVGSTALAAVFAVVCLEFRADQIIAGLAIWLIALGLAPFASSVLYGGTNSATNRNVTIPSLQEELAFLPAPESIPPAADLPVIGLIPVVRGVVRYVVGVALEASPVVYVMLAVVAAAWWTLNRTRFGRWVRAAGENPEALDTAGVSVTRVRYAAVLLSGVLSGIGGASLSLSIGQFIGNGPTMVNGKGFIAIVTYLLGNYNPIGTLISTLLFAGLDAIQLTLQARDVFALPSALVRTLPFVTVVIVLALFGRTRIPAAAGEHYESGEE